MRLGIAFLSANLLLAQTFSLQPAASGIAARLDGAAAFDPPSRSIFVFGGLASGAQNDLWAYSLEVNDWRELTPTGAKPPARFGHTLVYDAPRRRLILFGGQAAGFFSDVWAYDIARNAWQQLAADNAGPSKRYGHSAIYDASRDRMVISHGFTDSGRFDDTWSFWLRDNSWQNISPSTRPLRRCLHHAVYDGADRMLLYGGCASGAGPCPLGDLWEFDLRSGRWSEIPGGTKPPARQWYGTAFDEKQKRLVLFGGSGGGLLNDVWNYDPDTRQWRELQPAGDRPAARSRHQGVYAEGSVYFFGGSVASGLSNELWRLGEGRRPQVFDSGYANAFSGQGGAVAPNELVSLFGRDLGPAAPAFASFPLPLTLGGTRVTVNGVEAPLLYASESQINLLIPPQTAGDTARIVVEYGGVPGAAVVVPLAQSHPGLFPRVFHADSSTNTASNAADAGSIVVMFATGATRPEVWIGGQAAQVEFAGPIAGTAGLIQINARVPALGGGKTEVTLREGGVSSAAIDLWVR